MMLMNFLLHYLFCHLQIRSDLYDEFRNVSTVVGVRWKRFPRLTALVKGHRHGELSLLTGGTGSGKTTLMAELSLDLAMQGVSPWLD